MAPPKFADIGKAAKDLFGDDFGRRSALGCQMSTNTSGFIRWLSFQVYLQVGGQQRHSKGLSGRKARAVA
jgi:hypothetical protein